jgi:hypothetical protein
MLKYKDEFDKNWFDNVEIYLEEIDDIDTDNYNESIDENVNI